MPPEVAPNPHRLGSGESSFLAPSQAGFPAHDPPSEPVHSFCVRTPEGDAASRNGPFRLCLGGASWAAPGDLPELPIPAPRASVPHRQLVPMAALA